MGGVVERLVERLDLADAAVELEPIWSASVPDPAREARLAASVSDGDVAFALIPARGFDGWPEASLPALSAPFQLHSTAQAAVVAADPAVVDYLSRLEHAGLVGVAVIPEELRHLAALTPIVEVEQVEGLRVRTSQSGLAFHAEVLRALGATPVGDVGTNGILAGDADAAETSFGWLPTLPGGLTITGDLDLWVKFDVLVADPAVWGALDDAQRRAVRDAAAAVAAEPIDETESAERACVLGYRVAAAGQAALAPFESLAEPLLEGLLADPAHEPVVRAMNRAALLVPAPAFEPPAACRPPTGDAARPDAPIAGE